MADVGNRSWYTAYQSSILAMNARPTWAVNDASDDVEDEANGDVFLPDGDGTPAPGQTNEFTTELTGSPSTSPAAAAAAMNGDLSQLADANNNIEVDQPSKTEVNDMESDSAEGKRAARRPMWNWASFSEDYYEEFKPPKRYEKPPEKIQRSQSARVYIVGGSADNMCKACGERLYEMEKVIADRVAYHKRCFRCTLCQRSLSLANYNSIEGQPYCKSHQKDIITGGKISGTENIQLKQQPHLLSPSSSSPAAAATDVSAYSKFPLPLDERSRADGCETKPEMDELNWIQPQQQQQQEMEPTADFNLLKSRFEQTTDVTLPFPTTVSTGPKVSSTGQRNSTDYGVRSSISDVNDASKTAKRVRFSDVDLTCEFGSSSPSTSISAPPSNLVDDFPAAIQVQQQLQRQGTTDSTDSGTTNTPMMPAFQIDLAEPDREGLLPYGIDVNGPSKVNAIQEYAQIDDDDEEGVLPSVAGAFAKFRQLDLGEVEEMPPAERKPVRKITPPRQEPPRVVLLDSGAATVVPSNDTLKRSSAAEMTSQLVHSDPPPPLPTTPPPSVSVKVQPETAKSLQQMRPMASSGNAATPPNLQRAWKGDGANNATKEKEKAVGGHASGDWKTEGHQQRIFADQVPAENFSIRSDMGEDWRNKHIDEDRPEPGLTRSILFRWKNMEEEALQHMEQRTSATPGQAPGGRNSLTTTTTTTGQSPLGSSGGGSQKLRVDDLQFVAMNRRSLQEAPTETIESLTQTQKTSSELRPRYSATTGLGFTRARLAKFRQLEAISLEKTPQPPKQKTFKWGVREANILQRPITTPAGKTTHLHVPDVQSTTSGPAAQLPSTSTRHSAEFNQSKQTNATLHSTADHIPTVATSPQGRHSAEIHREFHDTKSPPPLPATPPPPASPSHSRQEIQTVSRTIADRYHDFDDDDVIGASTTRPEVDGGLPSVEQMRSALEHFRAMEDPNLPPPAPWTARPKSNSASGLRSVHRDELEPEVTCNGGFHLPDDTMNYF